MLSKHLLHNLLYSILNHLLLKVMTSTQLTTRALPKSVYSILKIIIIIVIRVITFKPLASPLQQIGGAKCYPGWCLRYRVALRCKATNGVAKFWAVTLRLASSRAPSPSSCPPYAAVTRCSEQVAAHWRGPIVIMHATFPLFRSARQVPQNAPDGERITQLARCITSSARHPPSPKPLSPQ